MKQKYLYIYLVALAAVFSCVQVDEGMLDENSAAEKIEMTFTATIDVEDADTKTVLDGELGSGTRKVLWQPSDAIGVTVTNGMYAGWPPVEKFTATITDESESATFEGSISFASEYRAFYPYQTELRDSMGFFVFNMPQVQKYVDGSFDPNSAPMVAVAKTGENLKFKNLCGILALRLSGDEAVKKVTFIGMDENGNAMPVSGTYEVNPAVEGDPELRCLRGVPSVTLECASEVALGSASSVPFYFVLPPATYSSFLVMIETMDGKIMLKEGKSPLTIKRSDVKPTAALQYVETVYIDLSERGNANSYIVPKAGLYTFDADVIGNGEFGIVEDANFHTSNTTISPNSVEVLWEDRDGVVTGVTLKDKKVHFMSTGLEGNALIAVKNAAGKIIWSWHVWVTDQPADHVYVNDRGTFTMLDRNLGAVRADRGAGEQWRESLGLRYQWGRKDPFVENKYKRLGVQLSLDELILYPTSYITNYDQWMTDLNQNLWSTSQKTIYDPCPVGYRVPVLDVWKGFTTNGDNADRASKINAAGTFDHGWNFVYDNETGNNAWYPTSTNTNIWGDWHNSESEAYYWSANHPDYQSSSAYFFAFYYNVYSDNPDFDCWVRYNGDVHGLANALPVRCMKDEGYVDTSFPTVKITSITELSSTGAKVTANVSDEGISVVTERGIVWGTSEDITKETAESILSGTGFGEYSITLTDLPHSTRYYVRAYAVNERGISYSEAKSFYTPYEGNAVNLSKDGTANCYIVPPVYSEYVFNAAVKGNSEESVGAIASVDVLWETRNDRNPINVGDVIDPESVCLEGNNVHFKLPFDPKPGNAVIAVKDALGTILWSWHIWVVDFDPVATQQTYISGAVMMDRNLGALNMTLGDVRSFGLMYQWGRKDPFTGSGVYDNYSDQYAYTAPSNAISYVYYDSTTDMIENTVVNPTVVYNDARWSEATNLWGYKKTKYDPCPAGWRVSDLAAWDGLNITYNSQTYLKADVPYSTPEACFPTTGYKQGDEYIHYVNHGAYFWVTEHCRFIDMYWDRNLELYNYRDVDYLHSVRCMKDDSTQDGSNEGYTGSDYEW